MAIPVVDPHPHPHPHPRPRLLARPPASSPARYTPSFSHPHAAWGSLHFLKHSPKRKQPLKPGVQLLPTCRVHSQHPLINHGCKPQQDPRRTGEGCRSCLLCLLLLRFPTGIFSSLISIGLVLISAVSKIEFRSPRPLCSERPSRSEAVDGGWMYPCISLQRISIQGRLRARRME